MELLEQDRAPGIVQVLLGVGDTRQPLADECSGLGPEQQVLAVTVGPLLPGL